MARQAPSAQCRKCRNTFYGWSAMTLCPNIGCGGELRMLRSIKISVREYGQTYIARADGKEASCTAGPQQAAEALTRKLLEGRPFTLGAITGMTFLASEEASSDAN